MINVLKDRVAVVTGSGSGLGRAYAMAIAREGAKVVINDLGCGTDGIGTSRMPADRVVEEINKAGGTAVANYDSVTTSQGADRIIQTAVDRFGRLDILVNNAGISRGKLVFDMTDEDFDLVIKTHLYGTFYCTRAASRIMKEQHYGRIVNISSVSGFGTLAGELNYSTAKEGIAVMTRTLSRDLVKYGITCNAIRPAADTRLGKPFVEERNYVAEVLGEPKMDTSVKIKVDGMPEDVVPLVLYLVSEHAKDISCCIFEIHGKYIALYEDPPFAKVQTLTKEEGRFTYDDLARVLPQTLTKGIHLPLTSMPNKGDKFANGAKGWIWNNNKLTQVPPQDVPTTKIAPNE